MRILILIFISLVSTKTFATNFCVFLESSELENHEVRRSYNPKRFTFAEKNLIHRTVALESFFAGISKVEALEIFRDESSAGEIIYYAIDTREVTLVRYWRGDREYGAFYSGTQLIAKIADSFISCIEE